MAIQYFDNQDLNGNRTRDAGDALLPQDYVTLSQLNAANAIGFAANIGNGVATSFNVVHNLGSEDVVVQVQDVASGDIVGVGSNVLDANTVVLTFSVAPALNAFRALVVRVV